MPAPTKIGDMSSPIAFNNSVTERAVAEMRAIADDLRTLAQDTSTELAAACEKDFSQVSQGGMSPMFAESQATIEQGLARWVQAHVAMADKISASADGLAAAHAKAKTEEEAASSEAGHIEGTAK